MTGCAIFTDRRAAGRQLADALSDYNRQAPIVLALPRGGVPIAYEVATSLRAPLELLIVRKIGAPGHMESGIGALVDGHPPELILNPDVDKLGIDPEYIEDQKVCKLTEIERLRSLYFGNRRTRAVAGRNIILVDDGIATGSTARAALRGLKRMDAAHVTLAVPIAHSAALDSLRLEWDDLVCLATPEPFHTVGIYYADGGQASDAEIVSLLRSAGH
ncbi:MAG TPA: phosphoribosyltransferase family protein [Nitrospira sp.]|nr:phosphoribosyltransferase family protein [Nitrospira sp.]